MPSVRSRSIRSGVSDPPILTHATGRPDRRPRPWEVCPDRPRGRAGRLGVVGWRGARHVTDDRGTPRPGGPLIAAWSPVGWSMTPMFGAAATSAALSPDRVGRARFPLVALAALRPHVTATALAMAAALAAHPRARPLAAGIGSAALASAAALGARARRTGGVAQQGAAVDRSHRAGRERARRPGRHGGARHGARARAARPRLAAGGGPGLPRQAAAAGRRAGLPGVGVRPRPARPTARVWCCWPPPGWAR